MPKIEKPSLTSSMICLLILIFSSCTKEDIKIELPTPTTPVDSLLIWKIPKNPDTLETTSIDNIFFDDKIIYTNGYLSSIPIDEEIIAVDSSGTRVWEWNDYEENNAKNSIHSDMRILDNKMVINERKESHCINMDNGQEVWRFIRPEGDPRISVGLDNMVMKTFHYGNAPSFDSTSIMIANVEEGIFKEVFKIRRTEEHSVIIPSVTSFIDTEGDTILVFQNDNLRVSPYEEVIDLYAYNIKWVHSALASSSWNVHPPIIDGDHIYFATNYTFFCFEKESGNLVWKKQLYHDFQGSNYLVYNNLIITNLDNGDLIAIHKNHGGTVWVLPGLSACCTHLRIHEDKIYMGNGDLFVIKAQTGAVLLRYKTPTKTEKGRSNALFLNGVAVDLENKRMYATDGYYLYCLKHPDF